MSSFLYAESKVIKLDINHYTPGRAIINNSYIIKDSYIPRKGFEHGKYTLSIESPIIRAESDLKRISSQTNEIIQRISLLTKCILFEALNTSEREIDSFTKELILEGECPAGWTTNYLQIKKDLQRKNTITSEITVTPNHFIEMEDSPFSEFILALSNYPSINQAVSDLLLFYNDADSVSFTARYMLLSKGLEIIDSIFPLEHRRHDNRIECFFPELIESFGKTTIKDLLALANQRKETRHYISNKQNVLSHPSMTEDELKQFYYLSNLLCVNTVRKELGLTIKTYTL